MGLLTMYDAAYPPTSPPAWDVAAGYAGGDTPHIWTIAEWNSQPARFRLPIYTRSNPNTNDPNIDAAKMLNRLAIIGAPKGTLTALDFETAINGSYVTAYNAAMKAGGYPVIIYGSQGFVLQNPQPSGGYWIAKYDNIKSLPNIAGVFAKQYANDTMLGQPWDGNVISDQLPLWDTRGGNVPVLDNTDLANIKAQAKAAVLDALNMSGDMAVPSGQSNNNGFYSNLLGAVQAAHNEHSGISSGVSSVNSFLTNEQRSFNASVALALNNLPEAVVAALPAGAGTEITAADVQLACRHALVEMLTELATAVPV